MRIRIEKPKGSKEFGVKILAGKVTEVVEVLKELQEQVPAIGIAFENLDVTILIGEDKE